jgi:hypothetical protein
MEMAAAGKKTGPPDGLCRSCHDAQPKITAARLEVELDKVLHFRHVDSKSIPGGAAEKDNCGQCHHKYDQRTKKTFYAQGKEACRYCHLDKPKDDVMSLGRPHLQCALPSRSANQGVKSRPLLSKGLLVAKKNREAVARLPNQEVRGSKRRTRTPDHVRSKSGAPRPGSPLMNPVAFDRKPREV